ncbi:MAG: TVP38/TMEM64 family protein [Clostridia bacterium]|nr:TVP38/TMEM64 family protein [Clostridia bacterium]MBQ6863692.1 TVP38/TMEM64 family protein [Clostridia bacterium]MBR2412975.1 TVP38/TMEM64 family protein [Clostridia bacterium]
MKKKYSLEQRARQITKAYGITLLVVAAVLLIISFLMHLEPVQAKYAQWLTYLDDFEYQITTLEDKWMIVIVLFLLFLVRCILPFYPLSVILVISGVVFPSWIAFLINMGGMALGMGIRFYTGKEMGEGYTLKLLRKYPIFDVILEKNGLSNSVLLFLFRLFPGVPPNSVSQIYGSLEFPVKKYFLISLAGIAPRMLMYSFIGRSVTDPLSPSFLAPIIVLLTLSGISLLGFHAIIALSVHLQEFITKKKVPPAGFKPTDHENQA